MKQINPDLTEDQKRVLFGRGTEAPFSGKYLNHDEHGNYSCANCGAKLFGSGSKYESTEPGLVGWPSFDKAIDGAVKFEADNSMGMKRTEVICSNCSAHLGHVFDADDAPSGKHFCINSCTLDFKAR